MTGVPPADAVPSLLRCVVVFAFLGPIFGWPISYWQLVAQSDHGNLSSRELANIFVATGAFGLFVSYAFGFLPALVAGLAHWKLRRRFNVAVATLVTTIIAAIAAILLGGLVAALFWDAEFAILQFFPLPGAISALLCSAIANMTTHRLSSPR